MNARLQILVFPLMLLMTQRVSAADGSKAVCGGEHANPTAVMQAVFARLAHQSLTARFCQNYSDVVTGDRPQECGQLWAAPDGKLRFAYDGKDGKLFVFNGRTAYFLEPEAAQMTLMENFGHTPMAQALKVLWGHGTWRGLFSFGPSRLAVQGPNERAIRLTPLQAKEQIAAIDVVVDTRVCEVIRSEARDPLGNVTRYSLSERKRGAQLDSALFVVKAPDGFSILRAPTGSGSERQSHRTTPTKRAGDVHQHPDIQLIESPEMKGP